MARGVITYREFAQKVRRFPLVPLLDGLARLGVELTNEFFGRAERTLPEDVRPFGVATVARTALLECNPHREDLPTREDLIQLVRLTISIEDPALREESSFERARALMMRIAYEQFGSQYSPSENIARSKSLLVDRAAACGDFPSLEEWEGGLGASVGQVMQVGFAMNVACLQNGGQISRALLCEPHVAPIFAPLTGPAALEIADRWFAAKPEELQVIGRGSELEGLEKWSFNPLAAKPLVRLEERYVAPVPHFLIDRFTTSGFYFIGGELFGGRFRDALGCLFEVYIGDQLRLLPCPSVVPEIEYDRPSRKTVDYFLVFDDVVVLVEVKTARPIEALRVGEPAGSDDLAVKLGKAIEQINRTHVDLEGGRFDELKIIPTDRPRIGLVVTLEPFHLANTPFLDDLLPAKSVPTLVTSSHELEGFVAGHLSDPELGKRLLEAANAPVNQPLSAIEGGTRARNPILDEGWKFIEHIREQRSEDRD